MYKGYILQQKEDKIIPTTLTDKGTVHSGQILAISHYRNDGEEFLKKLHRTYRRKILHLSPIKIIKLKMAGWKT